ncbi:hypothetical protein I6F15_31200 [Bradyrhizobium sp. BRP14]|nr:hypothetical protein [Bradyrhizobium sp. BRP14]
MRLVAKARQGDALLIETRTKIRMARDWEAAQETSRSIQIPSEVAYYGSKRHAYRQVLTRASRRSLPPLSVPTPGIFADAENMNSTWTTSQRRSSQDDCRSNCPGEFYPNE